MCNISLGGSGTVQLRRCLFIFVITINNIFLRFLLLDCAPPASLCVYVCASVCVRVSTHLPSCFMRLSLVCGFLTLFGLRI